MPRLSQQFPGNYGSPDNVNLEIENFVRYINSAELGNFTVGELLKKIFDENGQFDGPVEFRKSESGSLEYRIGEAVGSETVQWTTLIEAADLRGEPGRNVGELGAPIFTGRADFTAAAGDTAFNYAFTSADEILVYVNGLLKREGSSADYTTDESGGVNNAGVVTLTTAAALNDIVTIYKIRSNLITSYNRSDYSPTENQTVFPFTHTGETTIQVYKNGVLQRSGGSHDYLASSSNSTVTFTTAATPGDLISIITVENTTVRAVSGIMLEENFVHSDTGLLRLDKISIANNAISKDKVDSLTADLASKADIAVTNITPTNLRTGGIWIDTSQNPTQMKFFDGVSFLRTSPESSLPTFGPNDAGRFLRISGTGTAIETSSVDFSSLIPVTQRGAANGVAPLDSTGRLPQSRLPSVLSATSLYHSMATATNASTIMTRIFRQSIRIEGIAVQTTSGTCSVRIRVNNVDQGDTYAVSSTPNEVALTTPIEINAAAASRSIGFTVSNASSVNTLEVTLAISVLSS